MPQAPRPTNLTGTRNGVYSYPMLPQPEHFVAELVDHGGRFVGTISETARLSGPEPVDLRAEVAGTHAAGEVRFTKVYDGSAGWTHSVAYDGHLNAEGTEISGHWTLGSMQGRFLMVRASGKEESRAVRREELASVRG